MEVNEQKIPSNNNSNPVSRSTSIVVPPVSYRCAILITFIYLFFLNFKPSDPHLTAFIASKNISDTDINSKIYPVYTYSFMLVLPMGAILAELVSYKLSILMATCCRFGQAICLLFGKTIFHMQLVQFFYAIGLISENVFFSFVYKLVIPDYYQKITSYAQGIFLISSVMSSLLGDFLLNWTILDLEVLFYITVCTSGVCILIVLFLFPNMKHSDTSVKDKLKRMYYLSIHLYSNKIYFILVIWWALCYAAFQLAWSYEVSLYNNFKLEDDYNGVVIAVSLFFGSMSSFISGISYLEEFLRDYIYIILIVGTALVSCCLVACSSNMYYLTIVGYVLFYTLWEFMNPIFSAHTAQLTDEIPRVKSKKLNTTNSLSNINSGNINGGGGGGNIINGNNTNDIYSPLLITPTEFIKIDGNNNNIETSLSQQQNQQQQQQNGDNNNNSDIQIPLIPQAEDKQMKPFSLIFMVNNMFSLILQTLIVFFLFSIGEINIRWAYFVFAMIFAAGFLVLIILFVVSKCM